MSQRHYLGGICGSDGAYGIVFPDFPGCVSAGDSIDHVIEMGREALQFHIEGMAQDGDPIPEPTAVDFTRLQAEFGDDGREDVVWVAVVAITILMPDLPGTIAIAIKSDIVREIAARVQNSAETINTRQFIENAAIRELDRLKKSA